MRHKTSATLDVFWTLLPKGHASSKLCFEIVVAADAIAGLNDFSGDDLGVWDR